MKIYVYCVIYYGTYVNLFAKYANLLLLIATPVQTMCYSKKMYVFVVMQRFANLNFFDYSFYTFLQVFILAPNLTE